MEVLEIAVRQAKVFLVDGVEYRLEFPLPAVAEMEKKLGRSMKSPADWLNTKTEEVRDILAAGFSRNHPEDAERIADAICEYLEPEQINTVIDALCWAACPKAMARIQEQIEKSRDRAKAGLLPNVQSAAVN